MQNLSCTYQEQYQYQYLCAAQLTEYFECHRVDFGAFRISISEVCIYVSCVHYNNGSMMECRSPGGRL